MRSWPSAHGGFVVGDNLRRDINILPPQVMGRAIVTAAGDQRASIRR